MSGHPARAVVAVLWQLCRLLALAVLAFAVWGWTSGQWAGRLFPLVWPRPYLEMVSATAVFVLTGPRTCSASEQVINGLRGVGIEVVAIGDTTCGKPVGFLPEDEVAADDEAPDAAS